MKRRAQTDRSNPRRAQKGIRLVWLILILSLAAGCTLLIPSDQQPTSTTSGTTTSNSSTVKPSVTTQASSTAKPTITTLSPTPTNPPTTATTIKPTATTIAPTTVKPTATTTAPTTVKPTTTASSPGTVDLAKLSLETLSWWYTRPSPLHEELRATISTSIARMISPCSAIWQASPTTVPTVYLTMDEGYEFEENTSEILDIAADRNVRIAFFITGSYLRSRPDLVKRMVNEGHQVLNHTDTHPNLANLYRDQGAAAVLANIGKLETEFKALTGKAMPRLVRPPEGAYSERLLGLLKQNGYRTVFWSFAYRDWITTEQPSHDTALNQIIGELHDGSVILIHAVSTTNVAILPELIDSIRASGYRFGQLTEIP